jgi:hypothetical protein
VQEPGSGHGLGGRSDRALVMIGRSLVAAAVAGRSHELLESPVLLVGWVNTDRQQLLAIASDRRCAPRTRPALPEFAV